ncbi:radical SAM protein [Candidatus Dojkabacteria bacterium]|nr:radical SAM protein [Candidatus Dojkabacteria bacterium]
MKIKLIEAKSVLTKSQLPGCDYVINPYTGCTFGCSYCYADFTKRFTGHSGDEWGVYVDVKVNAANVLEKELERFKRKRLNQHKGLIADNGTSSKIIKILIGSVTDPYQGVEAKYKITRKCLQVLEKSRFPLEVSVLTKSHLVTRDIDVLKNIRNVSVGMTITATDDTVARILEGNAPPARLRLSALKKLNQAGIETYVCVNPLLPHFVANEKKLRKLFDAIKKTGNKEVWLEHINVGGNRLKRIKQMIVNKVPEAAEAFEQAKTSKYKDDLNRLLFRVLNDYSFKIGGGGIIDHKRKAIITNSNKTLKVKKGWKLDRV